MTQRTRGLGPLTGRMGMLYGGDYNPEQWDAATWREDIVLMRAAGVNIVTVGVFSWAALEPRPGEYRLEWMREVLDLLHAAGIAVDLATPTASPPPWLAHRHPDTLPETGDGVRLWYGSRNQFSASSAVYLEHVERITRVVAGEFASHPAVQMWHVGNELGQIDLSDVAAASFRAWLRARYGTIDKLNREWGTLVWSQAYTSFDEVLPPRRAPYHRNPALELDFRRFASDELLSLFRLQRDIIREYDAERPITTNLMGLFPLADYWSWAADLDVIADDAYPDPGDPDALVDAALTQNLMRSLGGGEPWMLMEAATGAVSFRDHNLTKSPERVRLEALQAVAHGADGVCYFQWRQARTGPERFHSAMLPHAGADTALHRGVRRLGRELAALREVAGTRVRSDIALVWDWPSWWAASGDGLPTRRHDPVDVLRRWHRMLWDAGFTVDVVAPHGDLTPYRLVLAPSLHIVDEAAAAGLESVLSRGGTVVVGPHSGVVDPSTAVHLGRFPGLLTDLLGASAEERMPLPADGLEAVWTDDADATPVRLHTYAEHARVDAAQPVLVVAGSSHLSGSVAVSRHARGDGVAWYVGAELPDEALARILTDACQDAGLVSASWLPSRVELIRRGHVLFVLNHTHEDVSLPVAPLRSALDAPPAASLADLLASAAIAAGPDAQYLCVPPLGVLALKETT